MDLITMTINGEPYVAVPRSEYERLTGAKPEQRDDVDWARAELGRSLKRAREFVNLSQAELAKKLKRSQTLISRAESGDMKVSSRYVADVLRACGLPQTWPKPANDPGLLDHKEGLSTGTGSAKKSRQVPKELRRRAAAR
jgi:transcriptional regulator with XRE-family HTH domain